MRKSEAISLFGSVKGVATALGISAPAVSMWPDTVPRLREYQIREIVAKRAAEKCDHAVPPSVDVKSSVPPSDGRA